MSLLRAYQDALVEEIQHREFFATLGIQVLSRKIKDVTSEIEKALASIGIALFVFPPEPKNFESNIPTPTFKQMSVRVRIAENPLANQTGKDAWDVWEETIKLHTWRCATPPCFGALFGQDKPFEDQSVDADLLRVFDALFTVQVVLKR